tara:strand:+ start:1031 stop:1423 length:393 start_codon:yes stop_codon:yes gene_type:complete
MIHFKALLLTVLAGLMAPLLFAAEIAGNWQHAEAPVWITIQVADGIATGHVVRNDQYPERVGREILKGFKKDKSKDDTWRGQVYADKQGEYKKAGISLSDAGLLEINVWVGFVSRTIQWTSVEEIPPVTN